MQQDLEEEVSVVNSIYDCLTKWADFIYTISVPDTEITLRMSFHGYPATKPLIYDGGRYQRQLEAILDDLFEPGEQVIFAFIDEARELQVTEPEPETEHHGEPEEDDTNEWVIGEEIRDRGSVFVGRALPVESEEQAIRAINSLKMDKRLARATHNMAAWRIIKGDLTTRNCDDDGETASGSRMLHLLDLTNAKNCVVVVSRWFGGTHLGPARFKHINGCARSALVNAGLI